MWGETRRSIYNQYYRIIYENILPMIKLACELGRIKLLWTRKPE